LLEKNRGFEEYMADPNIISHIRVWGFDSAPHEGKRIGGRTCQMFVAAARLMSDGPKKDLAVADSLVVAAKR
jgi:hypothetical protein